MLPGRRAKEEGQEEDEKSAIILGRTTAGKWIKSMRAQQDKRVKGGDGERERRGEGGEGRGGAEEGDRSILKSLLVGSFTRWADVSFLRVHRQAQMLLSFCRGNFADREKTMKSAFRSFLQDSSLRSVSEVWSPPDRGFSLLREAPLDLSYDMVPQSARGRVEAKTSETLLDKELLELESDCSKLQRLLTSEAGRNRMVEELPTPASLHPPPVPRPSPPSLPPSPPPSPPAHDAKLKDTEAEQVLSTPRGDHRLSSLVRIANDLSPPPSVKKPPKSPAWELALEQEIAAHRKTAMRNDAKSVRHADIKEEEAKEAGEGGEATWTIAKQGGEAGGAGGERAGVRVDDAVVQEVQALELELRSLSKELFTLVLPIASSSSKASFMREISCSHIGSFLSRQGQAFDGLLLELSFSLWRIFLLSSDTSNRVRVLFSRELPRSPLPRSSPLASLAGRTLLVPRVSLGALEEEGRRVSGGSVVWEDTREPTPRTVIEG
eukprot:755142-Hanusia_phi.AAC.10